MRRARILLHTSGAIGMLFLGACTDDPVPVGPEEPKAPVVGSVLLIGDGQTGVVGLDLGQLIGVRVLDSAGGPIPRLRVEFRAGPGGGSAKPPFVITNALGEATTIFQLGTTPGQFTDLATAIVPGYSGGPAIFSARVLPGQLRTLTAVSGDGQSGMVGTEVREPLTVEARDEFGNLLPDLPLYWLFTSPGGWTWEGMTLTDSSGIASTRAVLGRAEGVAEIRVETGGSSASAGFHLTATPLLSDFQITLLGTDSLPADVLEAIGTARRAWEAIIVGDLRPETVSLAPGECGIGGAVPSGALAVEDVLLVFRFDSIDGPDGEWGAGRPCRVRSDDHTTIVGVITLEVAELPTGEWTGTAIPGLKRFMGQALGFGTTWDSVHPSLLQGVPGPAPYFAGPGALRVAARFGQNTRVEQGLFGAWFYRMPGDPLGAWLPPDFVPGGDTRLSYLSIAAMADLGYRVSFASGGIGLQCDETWWGPCW